MVEADYHMKLVGMGLEPGVPGVESYLASIESDEIPQAMQVLRWWFTLRDDAVRKNEKGDAFVFRKQVLRLQSENERVSRRWPTSTHRRVVGIESVVRIAVYKTLQIDVGGVPRLRKAGRNLPAVDALCPARF